MTKVRALFTTCLALVFAVALQAQPINYEVFNNTNCDTDIYCLIANQGSCTVINGLFAGTAPGDQITNFTLAGTDQSVEYVVAIYAVGSGTFTLVGDPACGYNPSDVIAACAAAGGGTLTVTYNGPNNAEIQN